MEWKIDPHGHPLLPQGYCAVHTVVHFHEGVAMEEDDLPLMRSWSARRGGLPSAASI